MATRSSTPRAWQGPRGANEPDAAGRLCQGQYDQTSGTRQGLHGNLPAYYKDGLIWIAGRHVCAVRDGAMRRTFDATRELWRGRLAFRIDVLRLAVEHGATGIVATERASGRKWEIGMDAFRAQGQSLIHPKFGRQWACDLKHWQALGEPEPKAVQGVLL